MREKEKACTATKARSMCIFQYEYNHLSISSHITTNYVTNKNCPEETEYKNITTFYAKTPLTFKHYARKDK